MPDIRLGLNVLRRALAAFVGMTMAIGALVGVTLQSAPAGATPTGTVTAWGSNDVGESDVPVGLSDVVAVEGSWPTSAALKSDGTVVVWGDNAFGQTDVPAGLTGVTQISVGWDEIFALKSDGTVVEWGDAELFAPVPAGLSGVVAVSAAHDYVYALKADGTVVGWGYQSPLINDPALEVPAGLTGVVAIDGGGAHALALKSDGTVVAWGSNDENQIEVPAGLSGVAAVSAGQAVSFALKSNGTLVAWGNYGTAAANVPAGLNHVTAISSGYGHQLALKDDGTVVGWGANADGQIDIPVGLSGVTAIAAAGRHSLAVQGSFYGPVDAGGFTAVSPHRLLDTRAAGQTPCLTGTRDLRVTGGGTTIPDGVGSVALNVTVVSPGVPGYLTVFPAGATRPLASSLNYTAGTVVPNGVLIKVGDGGKVSIYASGGCPDVVVDVVGFYKGGGVIAPGGFVGLTPKRLLDTRSVGEGPCLSTARDLVVAGGDTTVPADAGSVALNVTAVTPLLPGFLTVYPSGEARPTASSLNYVTGQVVANNVTVKVGDLGSIALFASGGCPSVVVDVVGYFQGTNGSVSAWGDNYAGESDVPAGLRGLTAIAAGNSHSLALKADGTVVAWGDNGSGQTDIPAGLTGVKAIGAGYFFSLAVTSDGGVVAWGDNYGGQIDVPAGLSGVTAVAAGQNFVVALLEDGTVTAWGDNTYTQTDVPVGLTDVVQISANNTATVAVKSDGTTVAWGYDGYGQVAGAIGQTNITQVSVGVYDVVALKGDGTVTAWGINVHGSTDVPLDLSGAVAVAAGEQTSYAILSDGTIRAWGLLETICDNPDPGACDGFVPTIYSPPVGLSGITAIAADFNHALAIEGGALIGAGGLEGLTPHRLLDTREVGQQPCLTGSRDLVVTGGSTTVPEGARAVALNITVVSPIAAGYLTAYPAGVTRPLASTLNYVTGQVVPNGTIVKVGDLGSISIFANGGCPNVIVDVVGYYN